MLLGARTAAAGRYPKPEDDAERVAELRAYGILDTNPEEQFDHIVHLASRLLRAPLALVSLVEEDRQWFKAKVGLDACETSRDASFCAHAICRPEPVMVVPDACRDPRFAGNLLVTGAPGIRFYAGAPLVAPSGRRLGSLCVIDTRPRPEGIGAEEERMLVELAAAVVDRMELRRTRAGHEASQARFESIATSLPDAVVCACPKGLITFWNAAAEAMFGLAAAEALGQPLSVIVPEPARAHHEAGFARVAAGGEPRLRDRRLELTASGATARSSRSSCRSRRGWTSAGAASAPSCATPPSASEMRRGCATWRSTTRSPTCPTAPACTAACAARPRAAPAAARPPRSCSSTSTTSRM